MEEIFKPIPDFENYEVSNFGNVKSLNFNRTGVEQVLKPNTSKRKDVVVSLSKNGVHYTKKMHVLVAENFLDYVRVGQDIIVYHNDGNKANNCVSNLKVMSKSRMYKLKKEKL